MDFFERESRIAGSFARYRTVSGFVCHKDMARNLKRIIRYKNQQKLDWNL